MYELEMLPAWAGRKPEIVEKMLTPPSAGAEVHAPEVTAGGSSNGTSLTNGTAPLASSVAAFDTGPGALAPTPDDEEPSSSIADFDAGSSESEIDAAPPINASPTIADFDARVDVEPEPEPEPEPVPELEAEPDAELEPEAEPDAELEPEAEPELEPEPERGGPFLHEGQAVAPMAATDQEFDGSVTATIDRHFGSEQQLSFDEPDVGAPRKLLALAILLTVAVVAICVGLLAGYFFTR